MKKFWILYICTWKYDIFRKDFYSSCEKYLLTDWNFEKHYFVWTDSDKIKSNDKIHVIYQKNMGWPDNTLKRFHLFLSQRNELKKMDYLYFFNANIEIKELVNDEILPKFDNQIVVTLHPHYFNKSNVLFTYDRNPKSTAFIKKWEWSFYVAWGLNWGTNHSFLKLCEDMVQRIDIDNSHGVIALWHDESHLNRYIYDLEMNAQRWRFILLPPSYLYPEWFDFSFPSKILVRDKSKYIDVWRIKNANSWFIGYAHFLVKKFLRSLYKLKQKVINL